MTMTLLKAFLICLVLAVQTSSSFAQVIYNLEWSASGSSLISGTGTMVVNGTPTFFNGSGTPPWLDTLNCSLTINGTANYVLTKLTDIKFFHWSSASTLTSVSDIYIFKFNAHVLADPATDAFDLAVGTGALEITAYPSGGSAQTMTLTSFSAVPEPEEWAAIASTGLLAFGIWHRRSRKAKKA